MENKLTPNFEILNQLIKTLLPEEKIEISATGTIKVVWRDSQQKKKSKNCGNLYEYANEIIPLKAKSWVVVHSDATGNYSEFGKPLPKRVNKDIELDFLLGVFLSFVDEKQNNEFFTDNNTVKYTVKSCNGIKGFYNKSGKLRFLEYKGKRHYIPEIQPKLTTEIMTNDQLKLVPA